MTALVAYLLVALSSAAVLLLEILVVRLVAPYVGLTLETYTAAIGVALAGIAAGAALGGRAADARDPRRFVGPLLVLGGVTLMLTRPLVVVLGPELAGGAEAATLILVALAAGPPAALLSAVPPAVVRLRLRSLEETGRVVGRLSAVSTLGALAGSVLTGFVLLALFPVSGILLATGGLLVVVGLFVTARLSGMGGARLVALAGLAGSTTLLSGVSGVCRYETRYYCARVEEDRLRAGGRLLVLDNLRHAYVDLGDPAHLELPYAKRFGSVLDTFAPAGAPVRALHIGGGGFTMPRYLAATRPGSTGTVLEIDPDIVELARDRLGLNETPGLVIRVGDARTSLAAEPAGRYDIVVGDAFGALSVPWHLTTREFVAEIRRVLRPGGTYLLNMIDYPPLRFLAAELATLAAGFSHLAVLAEPGDLSGSGGGNFVLVASDRALPMAGLTTAAALRGERGGVGGAVVAARLAGGAAVLTDDRAPVDQLLTPRP